VQKVRSQSPAADAVSRNVTISEGIDSRYWFSIAGFIALGVVVMCGAAYMLYSAYSAQQAGVVRVGGSVVGIMLFLYSCFGFVVYGALFKDAAYLRSARTGWQPKWWRYIGIGLVGIALGGAAGALTQLPGEGLVLGVVVHSVTAFATHTRYLYHRHKRVGVP